MLKILINAYAMCPGMGSEQGMAWNWCVNLAKYCELHIITESEYRIQIENGLNSLTPGPSPKGEGGDLHQNMHIYYLPVGRDAVECQQIRKMCWNQGDWRFYRYYERWQRKAEKLAEKICEVNKIDILHQLNMIGFREPGYLWRVSQKTGIPFVWGPTDAKEGFPTNYLEGLSLKQRLFLRLKTAITQYQLGHDKRVDDAARQASLILGASRESVESFRKYKGIEAVLMNETGCQPNSEAAIKSNHKGDLQILWCGKMDVRKQLSIALESIAVLNKRGENVHLHIVGSGQTDSYQREAAELGVKDLITWHGVVSHDKVQVMMRALDILLFTSVAEGTPHVVLEALANGMPVVCHDCCGHGDTITDECGMKIPLGNPQQSAIAFADAIIDLQSRISEASEACFARAEELSWDNKAKEMVELYEKVKRIEA